MSEMTTGIRLSLVAAPMPTRTLPPRKELYDVLRACHICEPMQITQQTRAVGRRPKIFAQGMIAILA